MAESTDTRVEMVAVPMKVVDDKGHTLELMKYKGEPAVLVDGKFILRHSVLIRSLEHFTVNPNTNEVSG